MSSQIKTLVTGTWAMAQLLPVLQLARWWMYLSLNTSLYFRMDNRPFAIDPSKIEFVKDYSEKRPTDPASIRPIKKWSQSSGIGDRSAAE